MWRRWKKKLNHSNTDFTKQIDDEISHLKLDTKVRREFMLMEARLLDERREGIAEGEANANIATN